MTEPPTGLGVARAGVVARAGAGGDDLDREPGELARRPWMDDVALAPAGGRDPADIAEPGDEADGRP
ncbi:MAG: hypothetical protein AB7V62_18020, partial [Thermoleophilia bacterium]